MMSSLEGVSMLNEYNFGDFIWRRFTWRRFFPEVRRAHHTIKRPQPDDIDHATR